MKATIDVNGCLTLRPESSVEAYALKHWGNAYFEGLCQVEDMARKHAIPLPEHKATILIDANWPPIDGEPKP